MLSGFYAKYHKCQVRSEFDGNLRRILPTCTKTYGSGAARCLEVPDIECPTRTHITLDVVDARATGIVPFKLFSESTLYDTRREVLYSGHERRTSHGEKR